MTKKFVLVGVAIALILGLAGCDIFGGTTGVEGELELAAGVEGDLDETRVYLFDNPDFDGSAEESEDAVEDEDDETKATFEFEDIDADDYYLLAWKDVDDDDAISYGDLVGMYDGKYGDDEPEEIDVDEGEMTDVGTIKMYEYEGGGTVTSISVSGSLTDYIGYTGYYLNVVFSNDTQWDEYDSEDYTEVGLTFSNVTFSVPSEYQEGCYVIFWADECAYLEGVGYEDVAEWIYGFYGDQGGGEYSSLLLQETYTGINISVEWYAEDGCPYAYTDVAPRPDWTKTERIPSAR